jgi:hypothetical protein
LQKKPGGRSLFPLNLLYPWTNFSTGLSGLGGFIFQLSFLKIIPPFFLADPRKDGIPFE